MSIEAVLAIATVIKAAADDAVYNKELCRSLGHRVSLVPRQLSKIPDLSVLDQELIARLMKLLEEGHELVLKYRTASKLKRIFNSSSIKDKFVLFEKNLADCLNDLSLSVNINSAVVLDNISMQMLNVNETQQEGSKDAIDNVPIKPFIIDYNDIVFDIKRGIRKELNVSSSNRSGHHRIYMAKMKESKDQAGNDIVCIVKEPVGSLSSLSCDAQAIWKEQLSAVVSLLHPNICTTYGGGYEYAEPEEVGCPIVSQRYLVMEYQANGSLWDHMARDKLENVNKGIVLSFSVLYGLWAVHKKAASLEQAGQFLYCFDLNPAHILLDAACTPKLSHIGDNILLGGAENVSSNGVMWLAPEVIKGGWGKSIAASQVYSFGLLVSYILSGILPFDSKSLNSYQVTEAVRKNVPPARLTAINSNIPAFMVEIVGRCVSSDPYDRPSSSSLLCTMLNGIKEHDLLSGLEAHMSRVELDNLEMELKSQLNGHVSCSAVDSTSMEQEGMCSMAGFGEIVSAVENMGSALKLFGTFDGFGNNGAYIALYGDKIVVKSNPIFKHAKDNTCMVARGSVGSVVFHIDNTKSMDREQRMIMTKRVLLRVIPPYLRQGFRVIVNSWAVNLSSMGKILTKEAIVDSVNDEDESMNILHPSRAQELEAYLLENVFEYLQPEGRTDMYGSCFQLFNQCMQLLDTGPVFAFILTDGNHNTMAIPHHHPTVADGQSYFGMFDYQSKTMKWKPNGTSFDRENAEKFLANCFDGLIKKSLNCEHAIGCTIIGMGDASTDALSSLSKSLGDYCQYYGLTDIDQADIIFNKLDTAKQDTLKLLLQDNEKTVLTMTYNALEADVNVCVGSCVVEDHALLQYMHCCDEISYCLGSSDPVRLSVFPLDTKAILSTYSKMGPEAVELVVSGFVEVLRSIRSTSYEVSMTSLQSVFHQLLRDKQSIDRLKASFYSKRYRPCRRYSLFAGVRVWITELENLITSQIASYRMNVEAEVLQQGRDANEKIPSQIALERLQNNLRQAGKMVNRVKRHVAAVQNIRDKTVLLAARLFNKMELSVREAERDPQSEGGCELIVTTTVYRESNESISDTLCWKCSNEKPRLYFATVSPLAHIANDNQCSIAPETIPSAGVEIQSEMLSFPCILLRASFDLFSVIHCTPNFHTINIVHSNGVCPIYCAQEIWELCEAGNHSPGDVLPLFEDAPTGVLELKKPNMVLPLAHTPLLFELYACRGRAFQCGINITGDCMALIPCSYQWAKFFHDMVLCTTRLGVDDSDSLYNCCLMEGLKALVSFRYAVESQSIAPSMETLEMMLDPYLQGAMSITTTDDCISLSKSAVTEPSRSPVMSKSVTGVTCPVALAALVIQDGAVENAVASWSFMITSVFSRMCECISGQKMVRTEVIRNGTKVSLADYEEPYRYQVGSIQTILQTRFSEWSALTEEQKLEVVSTGHRSVELLKCLEEIVVDYLDKMSAVSTLNNWCELVYMWMCALMIRNNGIDQMKSELLECGELVELITQLRSIRDMVEDVASIRIPIVVTNTDNQLSMRAMVNTDYDAIIHLIDAIVITKVSPKVKYIRVQNPSFPVFAIKSNRDTKFEIRNETWNTNLPIANFSMIGNVNSGKSSLGGRLLVDLSLVDTHVLDKLGSAAEKLGHSTDLKYAWLMDRAAEERTKSLTIDPVYVGFQTPYRRYNLVDNPGHRDYTKNSSIGIFHSDIVVLVTSAVLSEIDLAELGHRSPAEEHLVTAYCFGIRQIIVAVNKMDLVNYSEEAFEAVVARMTVRIKKAGFNMKNVVFVPVSALKDVCILGSGDVGTSGVNEGSVMSWYKGVGLLEAMDAARLPARQNEKSFRLVIDSNMKVGGVGNVLCGKVERGVVSVGDVVSIYPHGPRNAVVRSIETHGQPRETAVAADDVGIVLEMESVSNAQHRKLKSSPSNYIGDIKRGSVMSLAKHVPVNIMEVIEVQILLLRKPLFKVGYSPVLTLHLETVRATVTKLIGIVGLDAKVIEQTPASAKPGQTIICELSLSHPVAAETVHDAPRLSRFLIKENRVINGIGYIRRKIA